MHGGKCMYYPLHNGYTCFSLFWGDPIRQSFLSFIDTFDKHFIVIRIYRAVRLLAYCGKYKLFIDCGCLYKFMFLEASKEVKIKQRFVLHIKSSRQCSVFNILYILYVICSLNIFMHFIHKNR